MLRTATAIFISLLLASAVAFAQDEIKPPGENASRAELEKWIVNALGKHASYSTRSMSVSTSKVKFVECKLSFSLLRKMHGPKPTEIVSTGLETKGVKHEVEVNVGQIEPNGIDVTDNVSPEVKTIVLRERYGSREAETRSVEITVKYEAAAAIRMALERVRTSCRAAGGFPSKAPKVRK